MFNSLKFSRVPFTFIFLMIISFFIPKDELSLKESHQVFLRIIDSNPNKNLTKKQRFEKGLPPDKFHEQIFELTINPYTGEPDYESKIRVQRDIETQKDVGDPFAVPGQSGATPWYELGPNDAAGRSRAALWDLSDGTKRRVFAGGVSGGLWKNNNITDASSAWTKINGVPGNLAV